MCGRYALYGPISRHREDDPLEFTFLDRRVSFVPHYNAAPTQHLPVYRMALALGHPVGQPLDPERGRELVPLKWGLIPSWAKDASIGAKMINARSETVQEKPAFRNAYKYRRCLVPANGFYEWQALPTGKQPHYITVQNVGVIAFAGLWERWTNRASGEIIDSFTILTCEANELVRKLHGRMPVILKEQDYESWLTGSVSDAQTLMKSFPAEAMLTYFVSKKVNRSSYDAPELIEPIEEPNNFF